MPSNTELSDPILLVTLSMPGDDRSRSVSPHSTSSSTRDLRGIRLFRAIGRRLSRKSRNYDYDFTDSSSSSEGQSDSGSGNNSPDSTSSKDTSDTTLRKVLNSLNLSNDRRSSDSNSDISSTSSSSSRKKSSPRKILRQPVSYTYVRGLSGLPTIRVPRSSVCCSQTCCRCHTPSCGR